MRLELALEVGREEEKGSQAVMEETFGSQVHPQS